MSAPKTPFTATSERGFEDLLAAELRALGAAAQPGPPGQVEGALPWSRLTGALRKSRHIRRLFVERARGPVGSLEELAELTRRARWEDVFRGGGVQVSAMARRSRMRHTGELAGAVMRGLRAWASARSLTVTEASREDAALRVALRIDGREARVSVDAAGELDDRGLPGGIPPALAAGILTRAGWTPGQDLVELFAGGGGFAQEARLAGAFRRGPLGCEAWPALQAAKGVESREAAARAGRVIVVERKPTRLVALREAGEALGWGESVEVKAQDARTPIALGPGPGWLIGRLPDSAGPVPFRPLPKLAGWLGGLGAPGWEMLWLARHAQVAPLLDNWRGPRLELTRLKVRAETWSLLRGSVAAT